jgi:hypothetical protein
VAVQLQTPDAAWCPRRRCPRPAPARGSAWAPRTARRSRPCRPARPRASCAWPAA